MSGFFTSQETQAKNMRMIGKNMSCYSCGLYKGDILHPKMQPFGRFKKGILNIGEFTNSSDDKAGKPFQGRESSIYSVFKQLGIDIEEDCLNVNAVMCHPYDKKTGGNRVPTTHEVDCCRINIIKFIEQYKPKLIFLFGKLALLSVIGTRWKGKVDSIEKWRGFVIPDQDFNTWIAPVYNPSFIKQSDRKEIETIWLQDLRNGLHYLYKEFPKYVEPSITVLDDDLSPLTKIKNTTTIAFDYETTGLKPHAKGHRIVCASVATDENNVFVFAMPNELSKREPFIELLNNRYIKKMAHNMKFEHTWSSVRLKTIVRGWDWDSMLAAHIIDNRPGISGLKFQTYINFGIVDYNRNVAPYLEATDSKNANSKNRLQEYFSTAEGKKETLRYCALDSVYEYRLAMKQKKEIEILSLPF